MECQSRSTAVSAEIFEQVMSGVWRGVGENTAAGMAPRATGLQCLWAIETLVKIAASTEYRSIRSLVLEKDPVAAKMDNLATGTVDTEQKIEKQPEEESKTVRLDEKSKSFFSEKSKKSMRSSKFTEAVVEKRSNADAGEKPMAQTFFISLGPEEEVDGKEENMRKAENDRLADEAKMKKAMEERLKERQKNAFANDKLLKDKKPFTFDYEGTYYGINPSKLPLETIRKMKDQYSKPEILGNKDKVSSEPTNILNEKMKEREARNNVKPAIEKDKPIFSAKSFSIAEALDDPSQVAEGVKITEIRGENKNITRQHKAKKLQGLKMYRLKEYQTFSKDKSFRQFPKSTSKKSSMLNISSSEAENKEQFSAKVVKFQKQAHKSTGKSEQSISNNKGAELDNALGRGLPFIRTKGLRFHDLGSTFKTLELNPSSKRSSHKAKSSRIHISDTLLYEESFLD